VRISCRSMLSNLERTWTQMNPPLLCRVFCYSRLITLVAGCHGDPKRAGSINIWRSGEAVPARRGKYREAAIQFL